MRKIKKLLLSIIVMGTAQFTFAQYTLKQVIVLNEGSFGGPVTVGSYDPAAKSYQNFDTIQARFATDVIIDSGFIYVAADTLLVKYDLNTKQRLAVQTVKGIRELAVWNNQLLVTRGEASPLPSYFQVYDKTNLNLLYELSALSGGATEVKVLNDTAYAAVTNFWGDMGKLAVIDLGGQSLNREVDLGPDGLDPENVEVYNGKIYTVNSMDWTNSSVSRYDASSAALQTTKMNRSSGCSGSVLYATNIYFQTSGEKQIGVFNTQNLTVWDSLQINQAVYGMGIDPVNASMYAGVTDYVSYGKIFIYDIYGAAIDSFDVGISPGTFAFDVLSSVGIDANTNSFSFNLYPNPVSSVINFAVNGNVQSYKLSLTDVLGRVIYEQDVKDGRKTQAIVVQNYPQGIYLLTVETDESKSTYKVVKY